MYSNGSSVYLIEPPNHDGGMIKLSHALRYSRRASNILMKNSLAGPINSLSDGYVSIIDPSGFLIETEKIIDEDENRIYIRELPTGQHFRSMDLNELLISFGNVFVFCDPFKPKIVAQYAARYGYRAVHVQSPSRRLFKVNITDYGPDAVQRTQLLEFSQSHITKKRQITSHGKTRQGCHLYRWSFQR